MKLKAGNKVIPLFEKKKAAPVQRPSFSGTNPGFPRPNTSFQKGMKPMGPGTKPSFSRASQPFQKGMKPMGAGTKPSYPGQRPVFKPGPSMHPGIGPSISTKKEKPKDITEIIANLPKDELAAYVSIILGLIFIFISVIIW